MAERTSDQPPTSEEVEGSYRELIGSLIGERDQALSDLRALREGLSDEVGRCREEMAFYGHSRLPTDGIVEHLDALLQSSGGR